MNTYLHRLGERVIVSNDDESTYPAIVERVSRNGIWVRDDTGAMHRVAWWRLYRQAGVSAPGEGDAG
jgi:hypothetical protein